MRTSRYKPIGWRGDSYRHYLARKGVATGRVAARKRFFASMAMMNSGAMDAGFPVQQPVTASRDSEKGNRERGGVKAAAAHKVTKEMLQQSPELREMFGVSLEEALYSPRYQPKFPVNEGAVNEVVRGLSERAPLETPPVAEERVPSMNIVFQRPEMSQPVEVAPEPMPEKVQEQQVSTPAVINPPEGFGG